ncbi:MAG: hypothetical protein J5379_02055 [Clostridiales bacterium]|nr:hypothetical protein [Clostridiales bacterium]
MPSLTSVKYTNKKVRKYAIIGGIVLGVVLVLSLGIYFLMRSGVFYKKKDTAASVFKMSAEMSQVEMESDLRKGYMFSRTTKTLMEDRKTDPWVLSWYVIPGTTRSVPAMESAFVDSLDQVLLLESYVLEGKRSKAETLIKAIDESLVDGSGLLLAFRRADELISPDSRTKEEMCDLYENPAYLKLETSPVSMAATTRYLRALMNYYDKWGDAKLLERIESLTKTIFDAGYVASYRSADQLARPTPIPVTEKSLITPEPQGEKTGNNKTGENIGDEGEDTDSDEKEETLVSLEGIELSSLDFDALRRACVLMPEYQSKYEDLIRIVEEGKISEELPLYAWLYNDAGYMYYTGSEGNADLVSSLYVMVHLAEIGRLDPDSYAWISQQIYNTGFLYTSYNIMSGEAASDVEAYEAYPLVLYLAQIKGDDNLFKTTFQAMMRKYATLDTSPVIYMFFRNVENSRVAVYARENLLVEIHLR